MKNDFILNDRQLPKIQELLKKCAQEAPAEIISTVLYGSKAKGDRNSLNEYEIMVMLENTTPVMNFIRFQNYVRMEILKQNLQKVKILEYTPETFEKILFEDTMVGTFLYIICRDHVILYDKDNYFIKILNKLIAGSEKSEETFLAQCIDFARELGSEKWERKWEKTLMQYRMLKRRKDDT